MKAHIATVSKAAVVLVALLSIGPLVTGLDLAFHFMPTQFPAVQNFPAAAPLGHVLWVGSGLVGVISAKRITPRWIPIDGEDIAAIEAVETTIGGDPNEPVAIYKQVVCREIGQSPHTIQGFEQRLFPLDQANRRDGRPSPG